MSLWTPGGEHPVVDDDSEPVGDEAPQGVDDHLDDDVDADGARFAALSPEERAEAEAMAAEMEEVRRQLASVPASVVVGNHLMGLYELAAIHLSSAPPALAEAQLAIDAMGAVVEALEGRLGEHEPTLRDALGQMRLAFVQLRTQATAQTEE
ncbi:MAG: hypothetical protein ACR2LQ_05835 [Acidimicrobiales bacterium]